jgi:putative ABC transport system substrate-binding protein
VAVVKTTRLNISEIGDPKDNSSDLPPDAFQRLSLDSYTAATSTSGAGMKRREFVGLVRSAAAAWPLPARAQISDRIRRISALVPLDVNDPLSKARIGAFKQGLQQLGWADGRNIGLEIRWAAANALDDGLSHMRSAYAERFRKYAAELVALAPDVVLAHSSPAVAALQQETRTIPIVFVGVVDPVGAGFVAGRHGLAVTSPVSSRWTMA